MLRSKVILTLVCRSGLLGKLVRHAARRERTSAQLFPMWSRRSLRLLWPSRSDRLLICGRKGGEGGRKGEREGEGEKEGGRKGGREGGKEEGREGGRRERKKEGRGGE